MPKIAEKRRKTPNFVKNGEPESVYSKIFMASDINVTFISII